MTTPPAPFSRAQLAFLSLYLLGAGGMAALAIDPSLLPDTAPASHDTSLRALLVAAAVMLLSLFAGALARAKWVRPLALFLHGLVALIALVGLVSLLLETPLFSGDATELGAKFAVHAILTAVWWSPWMRRALARDERQA